MKHILLLLTVFIFSACSKEKGYGRFNLKEGQEVELLVSHRYGSINDQPLLLPQNESPELPLSGFEDREPGYNYKVKAKMVPYKGPELMDGGPSDVLQFIKIISKEKYTDNEIFEISLIRGIIPSPDVVILRKEGNKYFINIGTTIHLSYSDEIVGEKLEEIWQAIKQNVNTGNRPVSKWKSIRATVSHDSKNFGKTYLVSKIELAE
ncbi:hypothetical protein [Sphingobacterium sp. HMA12]|uniref:hypothetical protein n=1 Tax=Sphingobacterium sp. HMA12 TaxID=2050894 RepID=UPI000CEA157E|nr:hypothetical protein [Sphingobacterium sp. HMA12]